MLITLRLQLQDNIKEICENIKEKAKKVLHLEEEPLGDGNIIDDMLKIDQFAKV